MCRIATQTKYIVNDRCCVVLWCTVFVCCVSRLHFHIYYNIHLTDSAIARRIGFNVFYSYCVFTAISFDHITTLVCELSMQYIYKPMDFIESASLWIYIYKIAQWSYIHICGNWYRNTQNLNKSVEKAVYFEYKMSRRWIETNTNEAPL